MDYYHIRVEMGEGIATQEVCHLQYYDLPTTIILLLEHWTLEHIVSRREVYIMEHQGFSKIGNGTLEYKPRRNNKIFIYGYPLGRTSKKLCTGSPKKRKKKGFYRS